jgi:esterase/lipase superfamily enzyme
LGKPVYASRYLSRKLQRMVNPAAFGLKGTGRNVLFFVHGFNNDVAAVLDRAAHLATTYGVEVVPFSWPANGGGVKGVASYKSDKRDAMASIGALDRAIARLNELLQELHTDHVQRIEAEATKRFGTDAEKWDRFFSAQAHKWCPFTINMMLHSMGNYVFKHLLQSSSYRGDALVFDNVLLVAADTNNAGHAEWVDRIQCRGRIFVTINERDSALAASRMKLGEQQLARLGHCPHSLDARKAVYVDFTDQAYVGDSHAYFEGRPLQQHAGKGLLPQGAQRRVCRCRRCRSTAGATCINRADTGRHAYGTCTGRGIHSFAGRLRCGSAPGPRESARRGWDRLAPVVVPHAHHPADAVRPGRWHHRGR